MCNRNIPDRRLPHNEAWMLSCGRRKLPLLSNIKKQPLRGKTIDSSPRRREGGRLVFSQAWPLFLTCHIMVIRNASPLHTKGQGDKSKSAYVTRPIHHGNEGQSVRCNQISPPKIWDELSLLAKCICGNGGSAALYKHTLLIKVFSGGVSLLFIKKKKELGEFCFSTFIFYTFGCEERD